MTYHLPAAAMLLAGAMACGVVPTDAGSPGAHQPTPAVAPGALAAIQATVDDPLVHDLVAALSGAPARERLGATLSAVARAAADALPSLDAQLRDALDQVRTGAADDQAARAALTLVLDHARTTLAATDAPQRRVGP